MEENNINKEQTLLNTIFSCNLLKDLDFYPTDDQFYNFVIEHFDRIFCSGNTSIIFFSIKNNLELNIHTFSSKCHTEIIKNTFSLFDNEMIRYLYYSDFTNLSLTLQNNYTFMVSKIYSDSTESIFLGLHSIKSRSISNNDISTFFEAVTIIKNKINIHKQIMHKNNANRHLSLRLKLLKVAGLINEFIVRSMDENDVLSILLIGITAGQGLGFNRTFILKLDESGSCLQGCRAIGPLDAFEAHATWENVDRQYTSFKEILNTFRNPALLETKSNKLIKRITIPFGNDSYNPFKDIFNYSKPVFIQFIDPFANFARELFELMGLTSFVAFPIKTEQEDYGVVIADNKFTNKYPCPDELELLENIIAQTANQLQNVRLYKNISGELESLKANQKEMDESREKLFNAEKYSIAGEILEKLAHTLKNPLVSIGGFARSLQRDDIARGKRKQYAEILLREVRRIENILDDVCNISHETSPSFKYHDINEIIKESLEIIKNELNKEKADITLNLSNVLPNIRIDKNQIIQVITNIIRNAFHAVKKKQVNPKIKIESIKSGDFVVTSISDNGIGIPEKDIDKLFNAFFSTKDIGTGLGLTISSQIIKNHNGFLTVKSRPNKGSTFYIHIPIEQ